MLGVDGVTWSMVSMVSPGRWCRCHLVDGVTSMLGVDGVTWSMVFTWSMVLMVSPRYLVCLA
jgi:hypothetical protein